MDVLQKSVWHPVWSERTGRSSGGCEAFGGSGFENAIEEPQSNPRNNGGIGDVEYGVGVRPTEQAPLRVHPVDDVTHSGAVDEVANGSREDANNGEAKKALSRLGGAKCETQQDHENGIQNEEKDVGGPSGEIAHEPPDCTGVADVSKVELKPVAASSLCPQGDRVVRRGLHGVKI